MDFILTAFGLGMVSYKAHGGDIPMRCVHLTDAMRPDAVRLECIHYHKY